ncbi:uncharacterized protein PGTG_10204 [Puccinia graminis f. sp. tritici CRL 75-36-700-3]|uniref:Uncharacterized protein n=1 Tax=Puccinia graminis f. sp. tritici (strain CRL 75-36-700-3 / race SCCL) TaxID=418459 RepID=E3KJK9_PUCGT|nr:uncharacterized protein PGTG_10204 [Puccinia graminis f. sp. tritici CRL 75-36-700-3]EFP84484.2 hypothetical protein PGTG_10204 [Puccinia graminis f. sp. tritici CRL 75-36-700-3]
MVQHHRVVCLVDVQIPHGTKVPSRLDIFVDSETATVAYLGRQILEKLKCENVTLAAVFFEKEFFDASKNQDILLKNVLEKGNNQHRYIVFDVHLKVSNPKHYTIRDGCATAAGAAYGSTMFLGVLNAVGFQATGIAAGSYAAMWMSWIGAVASGSVFATFQSVAAAGLGPIGLAITSVVGGLVGFGISRLA